MINFGTGTGCLTAPSPGLGRASARGAASADAAVGGMKNPAMQHCFLMSHLSLSLLDSLPCRERDGSYPKSPSEQLLLEQSEEIRPRRAPAARDPGTAAGTGTPRHNAGASSCRRRGGSGTPCPAQPSITRPDTLVPRADTPEARATLLRQGVRGSQSIPENLPAEKGAWCSILAKPKPGSWRMSHFFKSPGQVWSGRGWQPAPVKKLAEEERGGTGKGLCQHARVGTGRGRGGRGELPQGTGTSGPLGPPAMLILPMGAGTRHTGSQLPEVGPHGQCSRDGELGNHPGGTPRPGRAPGTPAHARWHRVHGHHAARISTHHRLCPRTASLPQRHLTSARGAWGRQQPGRSPSAPPVLGGKGGRAGDPGEPGGTESRRETRALDVHLRQKEGISRGIPPHRAHPGGSAHIPTGHPAPVPSRAPGGWWGPGIPQELDLLPPEDPFQASGGHGSPPGAAGCARVPSWLNPISPPPPRLCHFTLPTRTQHTVGAGRALLPGLKKPLISPATRCNDLSQGSRQSCFGEVAAAQC